MGQALRSSEGRESVTISLLHSGFESRARTSPNALAIVVGRERITYGELDERANKLAQHLRSLEAGPGDRIALCVRRDIDLYVGILGILKSGAAYVPIDPSLPEERFRFILEHSHACVVVTSGQQSPNHSVRRVDLQLDNDAISSQRSDAPLEGPCSDSEAYLIFTSGTTGVPKGVPIRHGQVAARVHSMAEIFGLQPSDRVLQFASIVYDAAVEQIFTTLTSGARLVALTETWSVDSLVELMAREKVNIAQFTSTVWEAVMQRLISGSSERPASLTLVALAGEAIDPSSVELWFTHYSIPLLNIYGPTETTISATVHRLERAEDPVLIGKPIPGVNVHVMDSEGKEVDRGQIGELWLSGAGTAYGYLDRPKLTEEKFVEGPDGMRAYRTGDRVRANGDGSLEFLGRFDDQVQIGGVRIEPGEIAAALRQHPQVSQAHIEVRKHHLNEVLVAHVVPRDHRRIPTAGLLRDFLSSKLPAPFLPSYFTILDQMPVLPNGKTDRRALTDIAIAPPVLPGDYIVPHPGLESRLAALWSVELGIERIGAEDDLLYLGAHSLRTMRIATAIARQEGVDLSTAEMHGASSVRAQAQLITMRREDPRRFQPITRRDQERRIPMSEQQKQIWFLNKLDPSDNSYRFQTVVSISGSLDLQIIDRVATELQRRHPVLRTTYSEDSDGFWQHIHEPQPVNATYVDLRSLPLQERSSAAHNTLRYAMELPMELSSLPLQAWTVIQTNDDAYEIVLVENHMVHDGWSFALLMNEFSVLYNAFQSDNSVELPELDLDYGDYALWQQEQLTAGSTFQSQLNAWQARLSDTPAVVSLQSDLPRPARMRHEGDVLRVDLPGSMPDRLRTFCRERRVTVFEMLFSTFCVFLARHTQQTDITVASAFANRRVPETQHILGMFVNTVLLRISVDPNARFDQILDQVQGEVSRAIDNQEAPFPEVVRRVNPERSAAANPLTNMMFSAHDSAIPELNLGGAIGTISYPSNGSSKQELSVILLPARESQIGSREINDQRITMEWEYNKALFREDTVSMLADRYIRILEEALRRPSVAVTQMTMGGDSEVFEVHDDQRKDSAGGSHAPWCDGVAVGPAAAAYWARTTPQSVALSDERGELTYAELEKNSRILAAELLRHGLRPGDRIVALLDNVRDYAISMLAVHWIGLAMMPVSCIEPTDVLSAILRDSVHVICSQSAVCLAEDHRIGWTVVDSTNNSGLRAPELDFAPVKDNDSVHILYEPIRGQDPTPPILQHGRLAMLLKWSIDYLPIRHGETVVAFPGQFDARSVWEIMRTFVAGATVVTASDLRLNDADKLFTWLREHNINHCTLPGRVATYLIRNFRDELSDLVWLGATGERVQASEWFRAPFTIATVYAPLQNSPLESLESWNPYEGLSNLGKSTSIGKAVPGASLQVVDRWGQIAPVAVPGEVWVSKCLDTIADPSKPTEADRQSYVPTGHIGYVTAKGTVCTIGSVDGRLRVKGYNVSVEEVEAALREIRYVRDCAVVPLRDADPLHGVRIVAFVTLIEEPSQRHGGAIGRELRNMMPDYMVPREIFTVPRIPLTATGIVDIAKLEEMSMDNQATTTAQSDSLEEVIAALWAEALQLEHVKPDDNFFDLGGHSLLATQLINQLHDRVGVRLKLSEIYEAPTVRAMAQVIFYRFVSSIREPVSPDLHD